MYRRRMVVPSPTPILMRTKKTKAVGIPTIDLSLDNKSGLINSIVEACENYGFLKVVNHGVSDDVISRLEQQGFDFFAKSPAEKDRAGPASPFGYGFKNIGPNGDMGELEYLLLHTNPIHVSERSKSISDDATEFCRAVNDYIEAAKGLACVILDLVGEGLGLPDKCAFSRLIRDVQNDSVLRLNHYPPSEKNVEDWERWDPSSLKLHQYGTAVAAVPNNRIGFGEHSDPQILTILRSNDVGGLQICQRDGLWVPVHPDPDAFYIMVGDSFQALTNGRFESVRHRAMANSVGTRARMSTVYFGAPPLNSWIIPLPPLEVPSLHEQIYKPFTWGDYKKAAYSLRLGDSRLDLFKIRNKRSASDHNSTQTHGRICK